MHVLIVEEDEKKMAELLMKGLGEENHSVSLAFDGRDALEMAQVFERSRRRSEPQPNISLCGLSRHQS